MISWSLSDVEIFNVRLAELSFPNLELTLALFDRDLLQNAGTMLPSNELFSLFPLEEYIYLI